MILPINNNLLTVEYNYTDRGLNIMKYNVYNPITGTNTLADNEDELNVIIKQIANDILSTRPITVNTLIEQDSDVHWTEHTVTTILTVS